ncbi:DUF6037 family protein [Campylobacter sp. MIT 21-1685]|uniref:DUF6037 family protein n=1 Tax=unclassified Campylobacter TaxID=2593542 RepID=UPI00224A5C8B|nr:MULTISPECIES: DUF6037 family protein [unclassified Campylobacter]MCX2683394.1 DUF6037 family protein [Campylobacter sp. MIT 21-1684]MCX2751679.1 DUF6037 family protein [Campylobacter sp. MIT 21-1682]MCX2807880.1 DUF6037 family protein [Campylobacter sp. MIT 21-1685]
MKMNGLVELYKSMKKQELSHTIFDYTHNSIEFSILFDIGVNPFQLLLVKKYSPLTLSLDINKGFILETLLEKEKYETLKEMLHIKKGGDNPFFINIFFKELDSKIPKEAKIPVLDENSKLVISRVYQCEEQDKIFPCGFIDWNNNGSKRGYSEKNREKTRLLYPDIYKAIQGKNISVRYSDDRTYANNKFSDLKNIK